jgi:hypothetical protein
MKIGKGDDQHSTGNPEAVVATAMAEPLILLGKISERTTHVNGSQRHAYMAMATTTVIRIGSPLTRKNNRPPALYK